MKKFLLFFLTIFSITYYINAQTYGWVDISSNIPDFPYDTTIINSGADTIIAGLTDLYFINDLEGWISTWHPFSDTAAILHTSDGGETFDVQITQYPTGAIHMLNSMEGFSGGKSGRTYRTIDGGTNWIPIGTIGVPLRDIIFPPQPYDTGYVCGDNGKIFKVHSSGVISMNSNAGTTNLSSITFPNISEGWVCGGQVILHYSSNTWNGDQSYPSGFYSSIYFTDNINGWAVGDNGKIIHTIDGLNWVTQTNLNSNSLFNVFFLNNNEGWAVGVNGTVLHSLNSGTSWTVEGVGITDEFLSGIYFTSFTNGYVVGNDKTLLKYTEIIGIGEAVESLNFKIYPNPTQNKIQIQCSEFKTESGIIEILSLDGKKILEKEIESGIENIELALNNLKSGMYFCRISTDKKRTTKKLIIE